MNKVIIYTDGACRGNGNADSIGAYAYTLLAPELSMFKYNAELIPPYSTNNQAEIKAVYSALQAIKRRDWEIVLYSDSNYVVQFLNDWRYKWKTKNWNVKKKNLNQLRTLSALVDSFDNIKFYHVDGHAGILGNEICDKLCNFRMDNISPLDNDNFKIMVNKFLAEYHVKPIYNMGVVQ